MLLWVKLHGKYAQEFEGFESQLFKVQEVHSQDLCKLKVKMLGIVLEIHCSIFIKRKGVDYPFDLGMFF